MVQSAKHSLVAHFGEKLMDQPDSTEKGWRCSLLYLKEVIWNLLAHQNNSGFEWVC